MPAPRHPRASALLGTILVAAAASCDPQPPRDEPAGQDLAAADCAGAATDSARAVCVALDGMARGQRLPSRVHAVRREGRGFCVETLPASPATVDGMGVVRVDPAGLIRSLAVVDSGGCGS